MTQSEAIKGKAFELGFSHVGIARADILEPERTLLNEWLRRGFHANMNYMEQNPDRRSNPMEVLPGAKSVVAVAFNYFTTTTHRRQTGNGNISRYAWGDDYHDLITPKVHQLEQFITTLFPDSESRSYVDTGPVMEKAWAVRAGIGWLGKHATVITRDSGSWIFLGEIITTASLEYDTPLEDFCGSCTACIDACPTDAIVEPYVIDATKCIPYLTIELKDDSIPGGENLNFDNWLFGCDTCQDVCPWNRFATPATEIEFQPRNHETSLNLNSVLQMSQDDFSKRFRKSPVKRSKHSGLQRNARTLLAQNAS